MQDLWRGTIPECDVVCDVDSILTSTWINQGPELGPERDVLHRVLETNMSNHEMSSDANDYTRFDGIEDSDDEGKAPSPPASTLQESLVDASICKDKGNSLFNEGDFEGSKVNYEDGNAYILLIYSLTHWFTRLLVCRLEQVEGVRT